MNKITMTMRPAPTVLLVASSVNRIISIEKILWREDKSVNKLILVEISGMLKTKYIPTIRLHVARIKSIALGVVLSAVEELPIRTKTRTSINERNIIESARTSIEDNVA